MPTHVDLIQPTSKPLESDDIAILGFSCRFPGDIDNANEFFEFLLAGGDGIIKVPEDRWDADAYYDEDKEKKNKMYVQRGGFINDIDLFDPQFFGIAPKEAHYIDPQHRWLLELSYQALENSGIKPSALRGSNTAVYIGQFMHDYEQIQVDAMSRGLMSSHSATGPSMTLTSNRISYTFDFTGPSVTLDTACSSSLVAVDLACQAILRGDSDVALAGGVNILLRPEMTMSICKASMLSPDGLCKSFDASANGYVRSEGAGIVVLKKLSDALRDGDPVLAVIKATGVNQDGQTNGITVPNGESQQKLFSTSLKRAGMRAQDIQYLEAHGTGTPVGDPIEINSMGAMLSLRDTDQPPCIVGSVKSNIGHTEAAAGMAGLIKTVLSLNKGIIPRNIHLNKINPAISLHDLNIHIASENTPWPRIAERPRAALVNSFGFGGTNANAIVQESPCRNHLTPEQVDDRESLHRYWLPISAKTNTALKSLAKDYRNYLDSPQAPNLLDVCYTASLKRENYKQRLVVAGASNAEIVAALDKYLVGEPSLEFVEGVEQPGLNNRIAFVFSGMGTQWLGMGKELYANEPVFKVAMDRCDKALAVYTGWSLIDKLYTNPVADLNNKTELAQPAIFAVQFALVELLASWYIKPSAIVGHSAGEVGAACAAGALSFDNAIRVIYHRSQLQSATEGMGKMLAVGLTEADLVPLLRGKEDKVSIAAINSEDALTLAGCATTLEEIAVELDQKGIFARFLNVGIPYHSPVMDQIKAALIEALAGLEVCEPHTPLYSTVSGVKSKAGDWGPEYWADNVREAVLFKAAIDAMITDGEQVFLEVSAHPALSSSIEKNLKKKNVAGISVPCLKRDANPELMLRRIIGSLHVAGVGLDWHSYYSEGRTIILPNYAWQRSSYWSEDEWARDARINNRSGHKGVAAPTHVLLGSPLASAFQLWQKNLDLHELSFLSDHRVEGEVVYPAAAYVETGLALALSRGAHAPVILDDLYFHRAFFPSETTATTIETGFDDATGAYNIRGVNPQTGSWTLYSEGVISEKQLSVTPAPLRIENLKIDLHQYFNKSEFYTHCEKLGLHYKNTFQSVEECWFAERKSLVHWVLPQAVQSNSDAYHLHPSILDGAFQGLFPTIQQGYLPVKIRQLRFYQRPSHSGYAYLFTHFKDATDICGDITIVNEQGDVLIELLGIELKATNMQAMQSVSAGRLYDFEWQHISRSQFSPEPSKGIWLVFADDGGITEELVLRLEAKGWQTRVVNSRAVTSAADMESILNRHSETYEGIVYAWALESCINPDCDAASVMTTTEAVLLPPLYLSQALTQLEIRLARGIFFVTKTAQPIALPLDDDIQPQQAALWGFARVLASEHPELGVSLIDLDNVNTNATTEEFLAEILREQYEQEVALRNGVRYVNRLRRLESSDLTHYQQAAVPLPTSAELVLSFAGQDVQVQQCAPVIKEPGKYILHVDDAGFDVYSLSQSIAPVLLVGHLDKAGADAYGEGSFLTLADKVCSALSLDADNFLPVPDDLNLVQLTNLIADYLLPYYSFNYDVSLSQDRNILILGHDTKLGKAAVELALNTGAQVHLLVNTQEEVEMLKQKGIQGLILDDSNNSFGQANDAIALHRIKMDCIVSATNTVNDSSLVNLLSTTGRWLHWGEASLSPIIKKSLIDNALGFQWLKWSQLIQSNRKVLFHCLKNVIAEIDRGALVSESVAHIDINSLSPFPTLQDGRVVLSMSAKPAHAVVAPLLSTVNKTGSYIVTGGLGGLGLSVMDWLVDVGAGAIVLIGRSAPSAAALMRIAAAKARQPTVEIKIWQADICNEADVKNMLAMIAQELPILRGIIHSAGVLDDGVIAQQNANKFSKVLLPKIQGTWLLHSLTASLYLDFFVCFSSVASIVGWAGQANYAAGNAFMDALANYRLRRGLASLSINWGPWAEVGMAANLESRDIQRMEAAGMFSLGTQDGIRAMEELLRYRVPHAGVFNMDWKRILALYPNPTLKTLLSHFMVDMAPSAAGSFKAELLAVNHAERSELLLQKIKTLLAEIIGLSDAEQVDKDTNIFEYGINSLMSMEFKNRLQSILSTTLPATLVLKYPTASAMVDPILVVLADAEVVAEQKSKSISNNDDIISLPNRHLLVRRATEHHWNLSQLLEVRNVSADHLWQALCLILEQNEGLRHCFFRNEEGVIYEKIAPLNKDNVLDIVDLSGVESELQSAQIEKLANQYQSSLEFSKKLYRFVYFDLGANQPARFLSIMHHGVFDGYSGMIFSRDLYGKVLMLSRGEKPPVPHKTTTIKEWGEYLYHYGNSDEVNGEFGYWTALPWDKCKNLLDFPEGLAANKLPDRTLHGTEFEVVQLINKECSLFLIENGKCSNEYSIGDVIFTAFATALAVATKSNTVNFDMMVAGRPQIFNDIDLSNTIGWLSDHIPVLVSMDSNETTQEKLASYQYQFQSIPHAGLGFKALKYFNNDDAIQSAMHKIPEQEILVNYIPYISGSSMSGGLGTRNSEAQSGDPIINIAKESPGITEPIEDRRLHQPSYVMINVVEQQYRISWNCRDNVYKKETIDRVTLLWKEEVEKIVKHYINIAGHVTIQKPTLMDA